MTREAQLAVQERAKQWCKSHMFPFDQSRVKHPVSKEEYDSIVKQPALKITYDIGGKAYYAYYIPPDYAIPKEDNNEIAELKVISNIPEAKVEAPKTVVETFKVIFLT